MSDARASRATLLVLAAATMVLAGCDGGADPASTSTTTTTTSTSSSEATTSSTTTTTTTYSPAPQVFDNAAMQDSVHQILTESYRVKKLGVVTCPPDRLVRKGLKFSCTAIIDGNPHKVPITVTSNDGAYDVGLPRESAERGK